MMKLIAVSDLHLDDVDSKEQSERIVKQMAKEKPHIILIGGDIAKTTKELKKSLSLFSEFDCLKLAYLGNHELKALEESEIGTHYGEMSRIFKQFGFHLLDEEPFIHDNVGFVGHSAWYDFSLYEGEFNEDISKKAWESFSKTYRAGGLSPKEFTDHSIKRMKEHIKKIENKCDVICLGMHHVAFREMLRYGHSDLYDYINLFMGSEKFRELFSHPKIKVGFCGHTHRSEKIEHKHGIVYNISSTEKQPFLVLNLKNIK